MLLQYLLAFRYNLPAHILGKLTDMCPIRTKAEYNL